MDAMSIIGNLVGIAVAVILIVVMYKNVGLTKEKIELYEDRRRMFSYSSKFRNFLDYSIFGSPVVFKVFLYKFDYSNVLGYLRTSKTESCRFFHVSYVDGKYVSTVYDVDSMGGISKLYKRKFKSLADIIDSFDGSVSVARGEYSNIDELYAKQEANRKKVEEEAKMKTYLAENPDEVRRIIGCTSKPSTKK